MYLSDLLAGGMPLEEATELLLNVMWTCIAAFLVFFMQAGFAVVESGFTRAKNAGNIIMKNLMDFVLGSIFFFLVGFALMFGSDAGGIVGMSGFFNPASLADGMGMKNGLPIGVFMIFHTVFCATSATIVSDEIFHLFNLQCMYFHLYLSDNRALDMVGRMAFGYRVPRFRGFYRGTYGRRCAGIYRSGHRRAEARKIYERGKSGSYSGA